MRRILDFFETIQDPRDTRYIKHPFDTVLGVGLLATFCGSLGWEQMEEFAHNSYDLLKHSFPFPQGIPSHDTFARLFEKLCPKALLLALRKTWQAYGRSPLEREHIALDGKTLCGSRDEPRQSRALHRVSAFAVVEKRVIDCAGVHGKGQEVALIQQLLQRMDLKNKLISIDAIGCRRDMCETIVAAGGDYLMALKRNQGALFEDVRQAFETGEGFELAQAFAVDKGHGRLEERTAHVIQNAAWFARHHAWPGLQQVGRIRRRTQRKGQVYIEERFYICSAALSVEAFQGAVRAHWAIDNSEHFILDDTRREDRLRMRKPGVCTTMALLQRMKLNLLQQAKKCWNLRSIPKVQRRLTASPQKIIQILGPPPT